MRFFRILIIICLPVLVFSCRKDSLITDPAARLGFSRDTLTFDTVFTSVGSATRHFKIFNNFNKTIKISDIHLAGGNSSHFRLNIDGVATNSAKDIEIAPNDSLYIFAAVTVDPNNQNNPFVITDSILFQTNGNNQKVILEAWGQNAHFFKGRIIPRGTQETWTNDKPYVILSNIFVDSNATLTIMPGCRIYNHQESVD